MTRVMTFKEYKGYDIAYNFYGDGRYTVQFCGDDVIFFTEDEAKAFIDEMDSDPYTRREY